MDIVKSLRQMRARAVVTSLEYSPRSARCTFVNKYAEATGEISDQVDDTNIDATSYFSEDVPVSTRPKSKLVILHYSPFKAVWDWVILLLVLYTAVVTPYSVAFVLNDNRSRRNLNTDFRTRLLNADTNPTDTLVLIDLLVDLMFIVDILISFRTTFVREGEVTRDPLKIAVNYIKGWFVIDAIAAIPFDLILFGSGTADTMTAAGVLKIVRLLRLLRVVRRTDQYFQYAAAMLLLLMVTFTLVAHWLACAFYAISNMERSHLQAKIGWLDQLAETMARPYVANDTTSGPTLRSKYITALYFTFTTLTSIGFGNVAPNTTAEKIFAIFSMMLGSLLSAAIFGNVSSIIIRWKQGSDEYQEQMTSVKDFAAFHHIPKAMSTRLTDSFQNTWQYSKGIDMNKVLKAFPECLQSDICLHLNRNLLSSCPAFSRASPGCLRSLCIKFKTTHAPPGDTLIHPGDIITSLYFITRGSLEVEHSGMTMVVIGRNDTLGVDICSNVAVAKSAYAVRALTYCDINTVDLDDLGAILRTYPEFAEDFVSTFDVTFNLESGRFIESKSITHVDPETRKFIRQKRPTLQARPREAKPRAMNAAWDSVLSKRGWKQGAKRNQIRRREPLQKRRPRIVEFSAESAGSKSDREIDGVASAITPQPRGAESKALRFSDDISEYRFDVPARSPSRSPYQTTGSISPSQGADSFHIAPDITACEVADRHRLTTSSIRPDSASQPSMPKYDISTTPTAMDPRHTPIYRSDVSLPTSSSSTDPEWITPYTSATSLISTNSKSRTQYHDTRDTKTLDIAPIYKVQALPSSTRHQNCVLPHCTGTSQNCPEFETAFDTLARRMDIFERDLYSTVDRILEVLGYSPKIPLHSAKQETPDDEFITCSDKSSVSLDVPKEIL